MLTRSRATEGLTSYKNGPSIWQQGLCTTKWSFRDVKRLICVIDGIIDGCYFRKMSHCHFLSAPNKMTEMNTAKQYVSGGTAKFL